MKGHLSWLAKKEALRRRLLLPEEAKRDFKLVWVPLAQWKISFPKGPCKETAFAFWTTSRCVRLCRILTSSISVTEIGCLNACGTKLAHKSLRDNLEKSIRAAQMVGISRAKWKRIFFSSWWYATAPAKLLKTTKAQCQNHQMLPHFDVEKK